MKKHLPSIMLSVLLMASPLAAADFSAAYRVNSQVITVYEIDQMSLLLDALGGSGKDPRQRAVEYLINDRLMVQEAARVEMEVEPILITRTLDSMAGGDGKGVELQQKLLDLGIEAKTIDTYIKSQIMKRSYAQARGSNRPIKSEERNQRINNIPDQVTPTVSVSELVIPYAEYGGRIPARYQYKLILERLAAGDSFDSIARKFSRAPTAKDGGKLPDIPKEGLNPQLTELITGLEPGSLAKPIETEGAMIIIRLNGYGENRQSLPRNPEVTYVDLFISASGGLNASKATASKLQAEVQSCKFAKSKAASLPNSQVHENEAVNTLSSGIALALARMEVGTSAIFERENGTSVLYLCDRQIKVPEEVQAAVDSRVITESVDAQLDGMLRDLRASAKIVKLQ